MSETIEELIKRKSKLEKIRPESFEHRNSLEWSIKQLQKKISSRIPKCKFSLNKRHNFKNAGVVRLGINQWICNCQNEGCDFFKNVNQVRKK